MPRPRKCRRICRLPRTLAFWPEDMAADVQAVVLTFDEYETIRLIDMMEMSQGQCSEHMQVARTTVQQIYATARRKLACSLVNGLPIRIAGGDFRLCCGDDRQCGSECVMRRLREAHKKPKGDTVMRIAVSYENGEIFQHFGRTRAFKIYDTSDEKIISSEIVGTNGQGHGALAEMLRALEVDVVICGKIGDGARSALAAAGIHLYSGIMGNADMAAERLAAGKLECNSGGACAHSGRSEEHACGEYGCGGKK